MADSAFRVKNGLQVNSVFTVDPGTGLANLTANLGIGSNVSLTVVGLNIGNSTVNVYMDSSHIAFNNAAPTLPLTLTQVTSQIGLPVGNTGQRATGANGHLRYNSETSSLEAFMGGSWSSLPNSTPVAASNSDIRIGSNATAFATANNLFGAAAPVTVAFSSTLTINLATGLNFQVGNATSTWALANVVSGLDPGRSGLIVLRSNNKSFTYGSMWRFPGGNNTVSANASSIDAIAYTVWNSSMIIASMVLDFK